MKKTITCDSPEFLAALKLGSASPLSPTWSASFPINTPRSVHRGCTNVQYSIQNNTKPRGTLITVLREQNARECREQRSADVVARAKKRTLIAAGLFAGIGGIELGLKRAGHTTALLCEIDPAARAVLKARFDGVDHHADVQLLNALPPKVDLVTAGFPCQDLSQAGMTQGMQGQNSSLVSHVFRLLRDHRVPWVVIENVPFMLQLARGHAMDYVIDQLEALGYAWAYRIVDTRAFGLPHRRRRVYIVASLNDDPRTILFADESAGPKCEDGNWREHACGFYWTEGTRGLGWALNSIPTLKGGSGLGIPSAPAVILPDGEIVTPSIEVAEALQGFPRSWTKAAETVGRPSLRWKLVGNAVSVPAAEWIGRRLAKPRRPIQANEVELRRGRGWPTAAFNAGYGRYAANVSEWPFARRARRSLAEYLAHETDRRSLSRKATAGFLKRANASRLRFPPHFLSLVEAHLHRT